VSDMGSSAVITTATAIETTYAGHRFRSRLEARWAVFFDHLRIEWKYEPQGYVVGSGSDRTYHYLPDFWLPRQDIWAEVKGQVDERDVAVLSAAAHPEHGLPSRDGGALTKDDAGADTLRLVVLSDIPRTFKFGIPLHTGLGWDHHLAKLQMHLVAWGVNDGGVAVPLCWPNPWTILRPRELTYPRTLIAEGDFPEVKRAYQAAQGARFEHGASGA
jgi:hypothetical protein